ncbi:chemotaxis protein [Magnetospirillum sp. UT-4]|uniref:chemotaxis protein n=1 Tax=Magnetospirillum sp. UT-4 TaxID=2681467 RepID=UPI0015719F02|nr:chemotaxis protein [Magnetospirillum sp. UT-4]
MFSGWQNIFHLLPHEFLIVILSLALPIGLSVGAAWLSGIVRNVEGIKAEVAALATREAPAGDRTEALSHLLQQQQVAMAAQLEAQIDASTRLAELTREARDLTAIRSETNAEAALLTLVQLFREHHETVSARLDAQATATARLTDLTAEARDLLALQAERSGNEAAMTALTNLFREHRESIAALLEAQTSATAQLVQLTRESRDGIVDELRSQRLLSQEITQELNSFSSARALAPEDKGAAGPGQRIDRMRALAEILTLALNDLSMTTTQLLTEHLNAAHGDRDGTRKFITTLTSAYFAGDKNVFFRTLQAEVTSHPEQIRACARTNDAARQQISKILREAQEIRTLVSACDPTDLVRIVFEDGELWALEFALTRHFDVDGNIISAA